jgi:hypothetical protein
MVIQESTLIFYIELELYMSKQLSKGKRTLLKILLVFTSILLVISIAAYAYLQSMLNLINRDNPIATISPDDEFFETDEPNGEGEEMNPDDILWPGDSEVRRDKTAGMEWTDFGNHSKGQSAKAGC